MRWTPRSGLIGALLLLAGVGCQSGSRTDSKTRSDADSARVPPESPASDSAQAVAVLVGYYDAINRKDYDRAYHLWASNGEASGKSFAEFRDGFATTEEVKLSVGQPGPIEGAAGSRYIEISVSIAARQSDGSQRGYSGPYTLRRSVVDGATPEQRQWRIYTAKIVEGQDRK